MRSSCASCSAAALPRARRRGSVYLTKASGVQGIRVNEGVGLEACRLLDSRRMVALDHGCGREGLQDAGFEGKVGGFEAS